MIMHALKSRHERCDQGASSVEYGLLVALIAAVIIVTVIGLGLVVKSLYQDPCSKIAAHTSSSC